MYFLWFVQWNFTRRDHQGNLGRVSGSGLVIGIQLKHEEINWNLEL